MGKKGDMLRWAKAQKSTYTFTRQQLEEHDKQVAQQAIERKEKQLKEYAHNVIEEDFNARNALLAGKEADVLAKVLCMCVSVPTRVLVRDFKWTPIGAEHRNDSRMKLARFVRAVQDEFENIINNELLDIRHYAKKAYEETGIYFEMDEEEVDADGASGVDTLQQNAQNA